MLVCGEIYIELSLLLLLENTKATQVDQDLMLNVFTRIFQSDMDLWIILVVQSRHIFLLCWHNYAVIVNVERAQDVVLHKRLNTQEAHAFSTLDGYSVAVFVVGG